jgi:hypothetical protein
VASLFRSKAVERIVNPTPLSGPNDAVFWKLWSWLKAYSRSDIERPQVTNDHGNYHIDGLIGIDESSGKASYPLGAIMLEELLHYIATTEDPQSSADFSPEFRQFITRIVSIALTTREVSHKRAFQCLLIRHLWELIKDREHTAEIPATHSG